jgi:hypothetical protein
MAARPGGGCDDPADGKRGVHNSGKLRHPPSIPEMSTPAALISGKRVGTADFPDMHGPSRPGSQAYECWWRVPARTTSLTLRA